jgi:hypothetical protein
VRFSVMLSRGWLTDPFGTAPGGGRRAINDRPKRITDRSIG